MEEDKSKFLEIAIEAARKAEEIILKYYQEDIEADIKDDLSPVTRADVGAEKEIVKTIQSQFPSHGFLGEEVAKDIKKKEYLWIIDPIDGTKNYIRKIPLFATQIALIKNGELILGLSNAPALKELMYAEKGKGAYCNGRRIQVSTIRELDKSYMLFGGVKYFEQHNMLKNLLSLINNTQGHRGIGDFWSYHLLAQGKADIMIEAQTKIWDIAAMKVIVEEAGGKVTDIEGNQVDLNTNSILATNKKLHQTVLDYLSR
jgi:histidinol-phosphatase